MRRDFKPLPGEELGRLFQSFRYTAYRLETLQEYRVPTEMEEFARFLDDENDGEGRSIVDPWIDRVVTPAKRAGKFMHRVHVVKTPLSDYLRFEFAWGYRHTVDAGENIKILAVEEGEWPVDLPVGYDYWLFDSSCLVAMHYENDGSYVGAELIEDPKRIIQANYLRDLAVNTAVSYENFAQSFDAHFKIKTHR
ncbi:DUF6879 family protein [Sphaerisporangium sp. B11E5]|uniref:DUF6879 family protein n=1 Tax=Sphaerisporangium sp. B11E5 TaxID=3153563 RepID=UPI00325F393C